MGTYFVDGARRVTLLVMVPVVACGLAMKASRLVLHMLPVPWWQDVLFVVPDLLFFAGLLSLVAAALALTAGRFAPFGVIVAQVAALVAFGVDVLAFGYFRATGTALDYATFAYSLGHSRDTAPILASEITLGTGLMLVAVPLWIAIAPWIWRGRSESRRPLIRSRRALIAVGLSVLCFAGSYAILLPDVPASLLRDPVVHLATGLLDATRPQRQSAPAHAQPRRMGPQKLERTSTTTPYNVVIVILELTRADATTAYNPELRTTPALAQLAKTGTRVERAYAIVPHTSKALVTILCGIEPQPGIEIIEAGSDGLPSACLARLLAGVGYDTAFFQAPHGNFERRAGLVRNMGYAHFFSGDQMPAEGFEKINYFGYEDAIVLGPSEHWLRTQAREPFFATYLSSATHHPYGVPSTHSHQEFSSGKWNTYLNAVNYVDGVMSRILAQYEAAGLNDRTIFIVVGDHGEAFGEHQLSVHDDVMYEEVLRVPLILRGPPAAGFPPTVTGPVNHLSLAPTILSALGLRSVGGEWEGGSIFGDPDSRPLYAACFRNPQCLATIRGNLKLLYFFQDKPPELFDLAADPGERVNLASTHRDLVNAWSSDVTQWARSVEEAHADRGAATLARYVRPTPPAVSSNPVTGRFGDLMEVLDCNARRRSRKFVEVSCELHVLSQLDDRYRLRVRGTIHDSETLVFDHKPVRGLYPMRNWKPGDYVNDNFEVDAPDHWETQPIALCLQLQADREDPVPVIPRPRDSDTCLPFAVVQPRETPSD